MGSTVTPEGAICRRTLLRGAAGAAALAASGGLPAWARPARHHHHLRRPDSRPFPHLPAGTPSLPQIRHIVVLMMENHSFDNVLGMVPHQVPGRQAVDGLTVSRGKLLDFNPGRHGRRVHARHAETPCQLDKKPSNAWDASHLAFNGGRNNGFVRASGPSAMWFWDRRDLPFTYSLAQHFPLGERYFCSVLAQTFPNRRFFFTGTASGTIDDSTGDGVTARNGTIWDRLDAHHINWRIYYQNQPSWLIVPGSFTAARAHRVHKMDKFFSDVAAGHLPEFTFLDPDYSTTSEENPQDIQVGERFIARVVHALTQAPTWRHTALFITYDEHGGYYDHVPPPKAIKPDNIPPKLAPGDVHAGYGRYGFRVPLIVVSPYARRHYASRVVQDHTSLDAFIERKWNLPAMTFRDANADPMLDYFNFRHPPFATPPRLDRKPRLGPGLTRCQAHGFHPPLPTTRSG